MLQLIITPEKCAADRAWNAGVRDGYAFGFEFWYDDDPVFPPIPPFVTAAERDAYDHGYGEAYPLGAIDAEKKRKGD